MAGLDLWVRDGLHQEPLEKETASLICQSENRQSPGTLFWETQLRQIHTWPFLRIVEKSETALSH